MHCVQQNHYMFDYFLAISGAKMDVLEDLGRLWGASGHLLASECDFGGVLARRSCRFWINFGVLFEIFGVFLVTCSSTEALSQKDFQKGLPGGPQEGSRLDGSSFFTFAAEPKKDSNMGAKMGRLAGQSLHYTTFWRIC